MARRAKKLVPWHVPCPRCGAGMQSVGSRFYSAWRCAEHGEVSDPTLELAPTQCSLGYAWVLPYLSLVDERPEVLSSGLPFFLASEWALMPQLPPAERRVRWDRACRATIAEAQDRARDPKRTITRGSKPATEPADAGF